MTRLPPQPPCQLGPAARWGPWGAEANAVAFSEAVAESVMCRGSAVCLLGVRA